MEIIINSPKHGEFKVLIDAEDFYKVKDFKWYINMDKNGKIFYVVHSKNKRKIKIHRIITDCPDGKVVDHINGDQLDNRKINLRICSIKENSRNKKDIYRKSSTSSYYRGVVYMPKLKNYQAGIKVDNKKIHLGYFKNQDQAAIAYNIAAVKYFGEFAKPNINIMMTKNVHLE